TLFGRNTEGGALSLVTRKPTGEFGMRATAGVGNLDSYNTEMHVDFPALGDFAFKVLLMGFIFRVRFESGGWHVCLTYDGRMLLIIDLWR
ncbi:hypothetical protein, partial [Mesorhizobium japonicum]|uniref:hypothetical protein n=1 Tax=Mesorhizobium japonicum TaxID=2066070 RepID=UPI003B5CDB85